MIIQKGLTYDNRQNIIVPNLPKNLGPWNPPLPGCSIEPLDTTPGAILRYVLYNRRPDQTKADLLSNWYYRETKNRINGLEGIIIRERVVFLKRARVYAVEFIYALPNRDSVEHKLWKERQLNGGFTRAERRAQAQAQQDRWDDYHSLRWNPAKHREKKRMREQMEARAAQARAQRRAQQPQRRFWLW